MKETPYIDVVYYDDVVIIKRVDDNKMDVMTLSYEDFDKLAWLVRKTAFGK